MLKREGSSPSLFFCLKNTEFKIFSFLLNTQILHVPITEMNILEVSNIISLIRSLGWTKLEGIEE